MLWSEDSAGTNAIGTALTIGRPLQIFSAEHFLPDQHAWWCSAAPIRDPGTGRVLGVVDLSGPLRTAHPHSLALVSAAARMGEQLLPSDPRPVAVPGRRARPGKGAAPAGRRPDDRRREPAARAALRVLGRQPLTLELDGGEPLELTRRQAEILAVLAMHPAGLTAEQLTLHVYGERGNCISARAAMSRLRKLLGRRLAAVPYRLVGDVSADFLEVEAALAAGDLDAALRAYRGPLLPDSEAPRVAQARDELEGALRRAAVAGTCAQLRVWLETESGRNDPQAMACFLRRAPRADPGRPLIAARLQSLCARWGLPAPEELGSPAAPALTPS
jgi:hypothetical protein